MGKSRQQFSLWYFVIALFLLVLLQNFFTAPHVQPLDYSEKALLRTGNIARVTLGTPSLQGTLRTEGIEQSLTPDKVATIVKTTGKEDTSGLHPFTVVRVDDPNLVQELEAAKVPYTGKIENTWVATLLSLGGARRDFRWPMGVLAAPYGAPGGADEYREEQSQSIYGKKHGGHLSGCRGD